MKNQMTFLNETEKIKAEIKVLQKKLDFLEQLSQTKTPCEEAYKKVFGYYPMTDVGDAHWEYFKDGYEQSQKDYKVGEYQETVQEPEPKEEPKTLYDICEEWSDDGSTPVSNLIDSIEEWMSQYTCDNYEACREYLNGYNACLETLRNSLR